jgi:hypothetical protein
MENDESVNSFTKISQIKDQLLSIGINVDDDDLVQTVVDGLSSAWEAFLVVVNGREIQPNFESLWHDCLQEEGRIREQRNPTKINQPIKRRSRSSSSPLLQVPSPTVRKLGWWIVGLLDT